MTKGGGGGSSQPKAEKGATIYIVESTWEEFEDVPCSSLEKAEKIWVEKGGSKSAKIRRVKLR